MGRVNRQPALRTGVWSGDTVSPQDVGEAMRDLDGAIRQMLPTAKLEFTSVYNPPITLAAPFVPSAILVGKCSITGTTTHVPGVAADWSYQDANLVINGGELVSGTSYDLTLLIFG